MRNLLGWAESATEPLRSYATGLLASAMDIADVAASFKERNAVLVSVSYHGSGCRSIAKLCG